MEKYTFLKPFPEEKIRSDIETLRAFVNNFNYDALRQVEVRGQSETSHRASDQATQQLFNLFCHHFLYSGNKELKQLYKDIDRWSVDKKNIILDLGNILLAFRNKVETAEKKFFLTTRHDEELGRLSSDSTWVQRFHYVIERELAQMQVEGEYLDFVKNIQSLGERIYNWISKNSPSDRDAYKHLSSPNQASRATLEMSDEEDMNISKKLF